MVDFLKHCNQLKEKGITNVIGKYNYVYVRTNTIRYNKKGNKNKLKRKFPNLRIIFKSKCLDLQRAEAGTRVSDIKYPPLGGYHMHYLGPRLTAAAKCNNTVLKRTFPDQFLSNRSRRKMT